MLTPYNPNVPQANNSPSQDQPTMLTNSQTWNSCWETDHTPYSSSSNVGLHQKVTLVQQSSSPTANATNGILFSQPDASNIPQLYWMLSAAAGGGIQQLTSYIAGGSSSAGSSGYYAYTLSVPSGGYLTIQQWFWILPGNLQIKMFQITGTNVSDRSQTIVAIPYYGTNQVLAPFAQQPILGFQGGNTLTVSASSYPSSPTNFTAYLNGLGINYSMFYSPSYTSPLYSYFIAGI